MFSIGIAVITILLFYQPAPVVEFFQSTPLVESQSGEYCPGNNYSASELDHALNQSIQVDFKGLNWSVLPYSFHLSNTQPSKHLGTGLKNQRNIIVIFIESFAQKHLVRRLPRTLKYLSHDVSKGDVYGQNFTVKRVGINSIPNRGALLLGHSYPKSFSHGGLKKETQKVSVSLVDKAKVAGMDVFISETVEKPCQHYSNTLSILNIGCSKFQEAYAEAFKGAGCVLQEEYSAGKKCPRFPYPSESLPTNCSNVGMHHIMAEQLRRSLSDSKGMLGIFNFLDFHPPRLEYTSPDLDAALVSVVSSLKHHGKPFTLLILGDHGHGFLSDGGDAVGILHSSRDQLGKEAKSRLQQPILSMLTLNRLISSQILDSSLGIPNSCLSEGIPDEYCRKCSGESSNSGGEWHYSFPETTANINAFTARILICEHLMDHTSVEGAEVQVVYNSSSCSAEFSFHFLLSSTILFKAVTSYKKFQECTSNIKPLMMHIRHSQDDAFNLKIDLTSDPPAPVNENEVFLDFGVVHDLVKHVVDVVG